MLHQITLVTIYTSFRQTLHLKSIWLFVKVSQTSRQNVVHQNVIDRKDWHVSYLPAPFTQNVCLFNASNDDDTSTHPPQNFAKTSLVRYYTTKTSLTSDISFGFESKTSFTKWYLTKCHNGKGTFGTLPFDLESSDY